jgi:hypothetical protein
MTKEYRGLNRGRGRDGVMATYAEHQLNEGSVADDKKGTPLAKDTAVSHPLQPALMSPGLIPMELLHGSATVNTIRGNGIVVTDRSKGHQNHQHHQHLTGITLMVG